jgi:hypothetical protein
MIVGILFGLISVEMRRFRPLPHLKEAEPIRSRLAEVAGEGKNIKKTKTVAPTEGIACIIIHGQQAK